MDFRTLALGVGVFCATFLVGWWLNIGGLASGMSKPAADGASTVGQAPPSVDQQKVAVQTPQAKATPVQPKVWQGPGMVRDQRVRDAVLAWSPTYRRPTNCAQDVRSGYTIAASKYAEALMRSAGCSNFPRCPMSEGQLARVWEANRAAADLPVAQAMAAAHAAGGLNERSFRGDIGRAVRVIAGRDFDPGPAPQCSSTRTRTSGFRFRFRR